MADSRYASVLKTVYFGFFFLLAFCPLLGGEGADGFDYASDIGVAADHSGIVCLAIHHPDLPAGLRVALVKLEKTQSVAYAEIVRAIPAACPNENADEAASNRYELRVLRGSLAPSAPVIALVNSTHPLRVVRGNVFSNLDGKGRPEYFRECTSSEGIHLTVWTGKPLAGKRRWHSFYYLGYDLESSCTAKDTAS